MKMSHNGDTLRDGPNQTQTTMNTSLQGLDLSRVYKNPVFHSRDAVETHDELRKALNEHALSWSPGEVDSVLYRLSTRRLTLMVLRYGPQVEVRPVPFDGFVLVQVPLRGRSIIESDGHTTSIGPGQVAIVAPQHDLRLCWSEHCEQLILRVPYGLAQEAAARAEVGGHTWPASQQFAPVTVLSNNLSAQWCSLVQSLLDHIVPDASLGQEGCHPAWLDHLELGLALFLLTQARDTPECSSSHHLTTVSRSLTDASSPSDACNEPQALTAARNYITSRLWAPLALEDIAKASGTSARSLHTMCKKAFGVGPMTWLRDIRLDAARKELTHGARCSITDVATAVGFTHLSRFSAYYKDRFGELPRSTFASRSASASRPGLRRLDS